MCVGNLLPAPKTPKVRTPPPPPPAPELEPTTPELGGEGNERETLRAARRGTRSLRIDMQVGGAGDRGGVNVPRGG